MKLISDYKKLVLKLLLQDPRINSVVLTNNEVPRSIEVHDDGSVTFGRTPKKWWNFLFGDKVTIGFRELSTLMLTAYCKYLPPNSGLEDILTREVIDKAYKNNNYEDIIDRFTLYAFLGVTEGEYKINKLKLIDKDPRQQYNAGGRTGSRRKVGEINAFMDLGGGQLPTTISLYEDD